MSASKAQVIAFMEQAFPNHPLIIEAVGAGSATVIYPITATELRPGGTVSGPTMMTLADVALYVALFGQLGIVPLAVTTNLNFNFLRKPSANADLVGECQMLKIGKTQAVGEVSIFSKGQPEPVAHAVGTYAIPSE